ncbi:hypothetical protein BT63DRAFT_71662 [Microthyrium microscopicum]|uniref:Peptidase S28 n=1 Tax=Microthyrium microscopicum TaxID=703497 RepID=A0A6A6U040_9PEZI|nr:hypothetical protein BT63DRAFT_71662 [Microthyrium microscopicum]
MKVLLCQAFAAVFCWSVTAIDNSIEESTLLAAPGLIGSGTFQQLIDHSDPKSGKFSERYFYDATKWKGPGSPVIFSTTGEEPIWTVVNNLSNKKELAAYLQKGAVKILAEKLGAAIVLLEHRYFGQSVPVSNLSDANMRFNTPQNSVADNVYFARNAVLAFDPNGSSVATKAPWVFIGGSLPGAIAAWTEKVSPGTFWSYWASSATSQGMSSSTYTLPIIEHGMPRNCSNDVAKVVAEIDRIGTSGTELEKQELKKSFGLSLLTHYDDFAAAVFRAIPDFQSGRDLSEFFAFCDIIEGVHGIPAQSNVAKNRPADTKPARPQLPGPEGVGLAKALAAYASISRFTWEGSPLIITLQTYNSRNPIYTGQQLNQRGPSPSSDTRAYRWWQCIWPSGFDPVAPANRNGSIISRFVSDEYMVHQCKMHFPEKMAQSHASWDELNAFTGGWSDRNSTRLLYISGDHDPWFHMTPLSPLRPGGALKSTEDRPALVIPGGHHAVDLQPECDRMPACVEVRAKAIEKTVHWVKEFRPPTVLG